MQWGSPDATQNRLLGDATLSLDANSMAVTALSLAIASLLVTRMSSKHPLYTSALFWTPSEVQNASADTPAGVLSQSLNTAEILKDGAGATWGFGVALVAATLITRLGAGAGFVSGFGVALGAATLITRLGAGAGFVSGFGVALGAATLITRLGAGAGFVSGFGVALGAGAAFGAGAGAAFGAGAGAAFGAGAGAAFGAGAGAAFGAGAGAAFGAGAGLGAGAAFGADFGTRNIDTNKLRPSW